MGLGHPRPPQGPLQHHALRRRPLARPLQGHRRAGLRRIVNTSSRRSSRARRASPTTRRARGRHRRPHHLHRALPSPARRHANAICPRARTRMTEDVFAGFQEPADGTLDPLAPSMCRRSSAISPHRRRLVNGQLLVVHGDGRRRRTAEGGGSVRRGEGDVHLAELTDCSPRTTRTTAAERDLRRRRSAGAEAAVAVSARATWVRGPTGGRPPVRALPVPAPCLSAAQAAADSASAAGGGGRAAAPTCSPSTHPRGACRSRWFRLPSVRPRRALLVASVRASDMWEVTPL